MGWGNYPSTPSLPSLLRSLDVVGGGELSRLISHQGHEELFGFLQSLSVSFTSRTSSGFPTVPVLPKGGIIRFLMGM